jgi:hypothetical protein
LVRIVSVKSCRGRAHARGRPPWQYDIERFQNEIRAGLKKITPIVDAA